MKKIGSINCLIVLALLFVSSNCLANVKLPAIFSDGMVLQQQSSANIWGWASPNEKVTITASWSNSPVVTNANSSGEWKAVISTPKASMNSNTLTIACNNSLTLKDVLIGEVWLASGQSNMGFSLKSDADAKTEIANANYPHIRYFSVKRQYGLQDFEDVPGSIWKNTTPENAGSFSAVAFYFAKKIQQEINVPVGIIFVAWGGTPAEAWTPREILTGDSILSQYIDRWKFIQANTGKDSVAYQSAVSKWKKDSIGKKPEEPQTFYYFKRPWREPSVLFNGMIDPVIPFGIKGVLWYQGESNVGYADEYYHLFTKMITSWRSKWQQPNLPFYFVQLAPFGYANLDGAAVVREAQYLTSKNIPETGMAVTVDVGNMENMHPVHKSKVGERLALIALAKSYGEEKINYKGPEYKKAEIEKGKVIIKFTSSLFAEGDKVQGFEIGYREAGTDSLLYVDAEAKIEDKKVVVWNDKVTNPVALRYGWLRIGDANLFNKEARPDGSVGRGLPASPFRIMLKEK
ncbi:MAG: sialate O-acetylesterase [Ferruginibacter sp.]